MLCATMLQGKLADARRLNERVLAIRAAAFGEEDVSYAHSLNTLGTLMCKNVSLELTLYGLLLYLCTHRRYNTGGSEC